MMITRFASDCCCMATGDCKLDAVSDSSELVLTDYDEPETELTVSCCTYLSLLFSFPCRFFSSFSNYSLFLSENGIAIST